MAAYAALVSLEITADQLLTILQSRGFSSNDQLQSQTASLLRNIDFLRFFLVASHPETMHDLEPQMRDAANQADYIIGRILSEQLRLLSYDRCSKFADNDDDDDAIEVIRQLQGASEAISSVVKKFGQVIRISDDAFLREITDFSSITRTYDEKMVGQWDELLDLKRLAHGGTSTLQVVAIVGMGGLGKTTLARRFYHDNSTLEKFEIRGWVTVSKEYSARDILLSIMKSIQPFIRAPKSRNESMENYVYKNLKGRRFLIILDDVWDREMLDFLIKTLPNDNNKSCILVTTRLQQVVLQTGAVEEKCYLMPKMNRLDSFTLLSQKIFKQRHCPDEFQRFVRDLAMRCGGLPLLMVLVAGLLSVIGKSESVRVQILDALSFFDVNDESLLEAAIHYVLFLIYTHLPHRLKSCFLYMGVFPEDREINVSKLSKLWLAQRFLLKRSNSSSSSSSKSCEAEEGYLQELVGLNLVSVLKRKSDGRIKSCCVHDIVRDFCLNEARKEEFHHFVTNSDADQDLVAGRGRIKVTFNLYNLERICESGSDDIHTIISFGSGKNPLINIGSFRQLKTLDVTNIALKSFPLEILELFLLRLLSLNYIAELPSSISNLQYLETLTIHPTDDLSSSTPLPCLVCLPSAIWKMPQLKHLVSFSWGTLPNLNGVLENLETLSALMNLECSDDVVRSIRNVRKLGIFYFGVGRASHSVRNLESLNQLEKLKLWVLVPFSSPQDLDLGFPTTLRKLHLRGIRLSSRDMKIIGQLPVLRVLKLVRNTLQDGQWILSGGAFPHLEYLLLEELYLREWTCNGDNVFFPTLRTLVIRACNGLTEIPRGVSKMGTLDLIEIVGGNKFLMESARRLRKKISDREPNIIRYFFESEPEIGNPDLKVVIKNQG